LSTELLFLQVSTGRDTFVPAAPGALHNSITITIILAGIFLGIFVKGGYESYASIACVFIVIELL